MVKISRPAVLFLSVQIGVEILDALSVLTKGLPTQNDVPRTTVLHGKAKARLRLETTVFTRKSSFHQGLV